MSNKKDNKTLGLSMEDMRVVENIIESQKKIHKYCGFLDLSNIVLYIIGKEIGGIEYIKLFERNKIVVEILDTSYTRMRSLSTLEDWNTRFILCVTFNEKGEPDINKCRLYDIPTVEYKKGKELTYGVTDGKDIHKINIMSNDIKGMEYRTLKEIVRYSFNKRSGKKGDSSDLSCVLVNYN